MSEKDRRIEKLDYLVSAAQIFGEAGDSKRGIEILSQTFKTIDLMKNYRISNAVSSTMTDRMLDSLNDDKLRCLISIANAFRELGDSEKGRKILISILKTSDRSTQREHIWSNHIPSIVRAFGKPDVTKATQKTLPQGAYVKYSIYQNPITATMRGTGSGISEAFNELDASENRKWLLSQILEATKSMENSDNKLNILIALSKVSGMLGDIEGGKKTLSQATKIMNSIENRDQEKDRNQTVSHGSIFKAYIELGDTKRGLEMLFQAINGISSVNNDESKTRLLTEIAAASNELGSKDETRKILSQLTEIATSMKSQSHKAFALASVGNVYLQLSDRIQAKNILNDATKSLELSRNIKQDRSYLQTRSFTSALRKVANLHTELGNWGETLRLAQYLNGNDKILVLSRILQVHAEQKNPGLIIRKRSNRDEITYSEYDDNINP